MTPSGLEIQNQLQRCQIDKLLFTLNQTPNDSSPINWTPDDFTSIFSVILKTADGEYLVSNARLRDLIDYTDYNSGVGGLSNDYSYIQAMLDLGSLNLENAQLVVTLSIPGKTNVNSQNVTVSVTGLRTNDNLSYRKSYESYHLLSDIRFANCLELYQTSVANTVFNENLRLTSAQGDQLIYPKVSRSAALASGNIETNIADWGIVWVSPDSLPQDVRVMLTSSGAVSSSVSNTMLFRVSLY